MILNDVLWRVWKEAFVTCFKVQSNHLLEGSEENLANFVQDIRSPGWESNPGRLEYEGEVNQVLWFFNKKNINTFLSKLISFYV